MNLLTAYLAPHQRLHAGIVQFYDFLLDWLGNHILDRTGNLTSGKFQNQHCRSLESIRNHIRVASPFIAETCFCLKRMAL